MSTFKSHEEYLKAHAAYLKMRSKWQNVKAERDTLQRWLDVLFDASDSYISDKDNHEGLGPISSQIKSENQFRQFREVVDAERARREVR